MEQLGDLDVGRKSPHGRGRVVAMEREQAVEHRGPTQSESGELLVVRADVDRQAHPGSPAAVVTSHAVQHRNGAR
jgi:hypothetical protein